MALLICWCLNFAWSIPKEIEVWFLSPPLTGQWNQFMRPRLKKWGWMAQSCEPVADFCFDAKIGLYPQVRAPLEQEKKFEIDEGLPQLPVATSIDRSLVNCDAAYAFDIFCGKAQTENALNVGGDLEVWIDTSSSMRAIDGADAKGNCQRSQFVEELLASCGKEKKPVLKGFDTQLHDLSHPNQACVNQGLNDAKRLMDWMENSSVKKLILITDVYEYQVELSRFLDGHHAKLRGDKGIFPATKIPELAKACTGI